MGLNRRNIENEETAANNGLSLNFRWKFNSEIMVEAIIKISSDNETLYMHGLHLQNTEKE